MPADNPLAQFTITLWRSGEIFDVMIARDGERALHMAIMMLGELTALQHGDRLTVRVD